MLNFRHIDIEDKPRADTFFAKSGSRATSGCFAPIFIWQEHYGTQICFDSDCMFFKTAVHSDAPFYLFPVGDDIRAEHIELLREDAHAHGTKLRFTCISAQNRDLLSELFPNGFDYEELRDSFDYIYSADKLISLSGKKLHSKRNFTNRFYQDYAGRWKYTVMDGSDRELILNFWREWHLENMHKDDLSLDAEFNALSSALTHFDALGLRAGGLFVDGNLTAFSLGCPINNDTFDVQIEKALTSVDGAYAVINREFAEANCRDFKYINREEDLGLEGLRKAKLSYQPEFLIEKFGAVEK